MNAVMEIKRKYEDQEDWFMPLFRSAEIQARREARMRRDAMMVMREQERRREREKRREQERAERERRETAHREEVAGTAASVAGGLIMAATLLSLAMMV